MADIWIAFSDCGAHVRMWSAEGPQKIADAGLNPLRFVQADAATPPADAALADELDNIALAFDRNSQYATTIRKAAAALRARPQDVVEKYRHHLELLRDDCTYPAGQVGAVVLNGYRMEIIRDALTAMLAASQSATGAK